MQLPAAMITAPAAASADAPPHERVHILDVLRGLALFGMLLVHVTYYMDGAGALHDAVTAAIGLAAVGKFYTLFAFLFGIGFAMQIRQAERRGTRFSAQYLRRLAGLAALGLLMHLLLGYWVLLQYAIWGCVLLLFRRASPRVLTVVIALCLVAPALRHAVSGTAALIVDGREGAEASWEGYTAVRGAQLEAAYQAVETGTYTEAVGGRGRRLALWLSGATIWFSGDPLILFLLGLLVVRAGVLDDLERRRGLILRVGGLGFLVFAAALVLHRWWEPTIDIGYVRYTAAATALLGMVGEQWLMLTYAAATTLLYLGRERWRRRLHHLAAPGRLALSNYVMQVVVLELFFSRFMLSLSLPTLLGLAFAVAFFLLQIVLSQSWLRRFRYGPFEWALRSLTYGRVEPLRLVKPVTVVAMSV